MVNKQKIIRTILAAIDEINQQLPKEQQLEKSAKTTLLGEPGQLDSFALVILIVAVEQKIVEDFKVTVTLTDENTISRSQDNSPFRTVKTLAEHISSLLKEKTAGI